jgi:ABC-type multidrug transport system fused ATPase/permease subunit
MEDHNYVSLFGTIRKLLTYVSIRRKIQFIYLIILTIISSLAEMLSIGAAFPFIKIITDPGKIFSDNFYLNILEFLNITTEEELIIFGSCAFGVLAFIAGFIRVLLTYINLRLATAVSSDIYLVVYSNILYKPYFYHINKNSNEILSIITNKVQNITAAFTNCISIFTSLIIFFSIIFILFTIDWLSTTYAVIFFFFSYFFIFRISKIKLSKNSRLITKQQDLVVKATNEGLGGIRDIIIDNTQQHFIDIYRSAVFKVQKAIAQNNFISQSPRFILEAVALVFVSIIIILLSKQKINGVYDILPVLGSLAFGAQRILPLMNQMYQAHTANRGIVYSLLDVIEILEKKNELSLVCENKILSFNKSISAKNIKFSYKNKNTHVFKNLSFEISKGAKVGITGPSGCGKSTLLDLIMGLLDPTEGEILVDNIPIKDCKNQWQKKIAHVPQFIYLADTTIAENIAFGISKGQIDLKKVKNAAKMAQIQDFIESKELGYDEIVGERGIKLSGGQRQRLGIARALYKEAELLILDEATSALDYATEDSLMKVIDFLDKKITVIIISHRISFLKNCTYFIRL